MENQGTTVQENITGARINYVYTEIQNLQIQPTEHNVRILAGCQNELRKAYGENQTQAEENRQLREKVAQMEKRIAEMEGFMAGGEAKPADGEGAETPESAVEMHAEENEEG